MLLGKLLRKFLKNIISVDNTWIYTRSYIFLLFSLESKRKHRGRVARRVERCLIAIRNAFENRVASVRTVLNERYESIYSNCWDSQEARNVHFYGIRWSNEHLLRIRVWFNRETKLSIRVKITLSQRCAITSFRWWIINNFLTENCAQSRSMKRWIIMKKLLLKIKIKFFFEKKSLVTLSSSPHFT